MLLLKGVNQQLIMIKNIIVILYNQSNKVIDEEVKNTVIENMNQLEL